MARGWESKSVEEAQLEALEARRAARDTPPARTPEQIRRESEIEHLELARTCVLNDLEKTSNPRYREQLKSSLQHLERKLAELRGSGG